MQCSVPRFIQVLAALMVISCGSASPEAGLPADAATPEAHPPTEAAPPDDVVEPPEEAAADVGDAMTDAPATGPDAGKPFAPTGPVSCDSGGEDAGSRGAEAPFGEAVVGLCRAALGCKATWTFAAPPDSYRYKGTPNQKLLWRVWYYGWAQRAGTAAQKTDARDFLVDFFETERASGHYAQGNADEVLTTSHYEIWSNGMTCARLLALHYKESKLLSVTGRWWRSEKALLDLLQRDGSIDAPGARFSPGQAGPSNLRDTLYAMLSGRPLPGKAVVPTAPWWSDYYNVGAWTLREILRTGDDLTVVGAGPSDLPPLHDPLNLHVKGADYVFEFPQLRGALQPIFWVARIGGTVTRAPYVDGTPVTPSMPAPKLPGATLTVVPGIP